MRNLLAIIFFFICTKINATNYYVSNSGADGNNGTTTSTPWATITKVNSFFTALTFAPGDSILFKRGDSFYGALVVKESGNSTNPIVIGAYGSGAKPIISGFTTTSGWTNSGNIWTSGIVSDAGLVNMVTFANVPVQMGRWPNATWMSIDNVVSGVSLTDAALPASPDWDGGQVVIRKVAWVIGRETITNHTGTTITYTNNSPYGGSAGYGYFIENHLSTLDIQNEWYWNNSTKRLVVYSTSSPSNVKVASRDTLLSIGQYDYITIDNIRFEGANVAGVCFGAQGALIMQSINTKIQFCTFEFCGRDAIYSTNSTGATITNNNINHCWNNGIYGENEGGKTLNATVRYDTIRNVGKSAGMGFLSDGARYSFSHSGIVILGDNALIQYNVLDSIGYNPVSFHYSNSKVLNNVITNFNFVKDDGAGVYTFDMNVSGATIDVGLQIKNNIIHNGIGAGPGKLVAFPQSMGIYSDDKSNNEDIIGNSIDSTQTAGIYIHNSTNILVRDNTVFSSPDIELMVHDNIAPGFPNRGMSIRNNIYFASQPSQYIRRFRTILGAGDVAATYSNMDSNIYARPSLPLPPVIATTTSAGGLNYTLAQWKSTFPSYDAATITIPVNTGACLYRYNASDTARIISFPGLSYKDPRGVVYNNSAVLPQKYTSIILIPNGNAPVVNQAPTADAGANKNITLPTNFTSVTGSGEDTDGTIQSYLWEWVSGPATFSILTPNDSTTIITNLIEGTYTFRLTVRDNGNLTGSDVMSVTVAPAPPVNQAPVSDAGEDQIITLPTSTTAMTGSGTDADGTVDTYLWQKLAGSPAGGTITTSSSATSGITALQVGVYQYRLTVTDDDGAISTDDMSITVNAAPNISPVSDAGTDQTITLPTNTATIDGSSSSDADGTVDSYLWNKVSGPVSGSITSNTSAITGLTSLVQGVYTFQLIVTDNQGATGRDTVTVTVNAAANLTPQADAGANIEMTLPNDFALLVGVGTDADGTIISYNWAKTSGPATFSILDPTNDSTDIQNLVEGVYEFELTVTDNIGATARDKIQITVNAAPNQAPTADAGEDKVITLPTNTTTLDGSGTDADGTITYSWLKISGPATGSITSPTAASTGLTALVEGIYQFELSVTDDDGSVTKDTAMVQVNPAIILFNPTADAGENQVVTLPVSSVTLDGSGTDSDGTISSYAWVKISGTGGTISNANIAAPNVTGLTAGTYIYQLTVTDNDGLTGTDTVQITVNPIAEPAKVVRGRKFMTN